MADNDHRSVIDKQKLRRAALVSGVIEGLGNLALDQITLVATHVQQPFNPVSGTVYSSINALSLAAAGYEDPRWMTYKQAASVGAQVAMGEKATFVEFWDKEKKDYVYTAVFNASQIDGLEPYRSEPWNRNEAKAQVAAMVQGTGVTLGPDDYGLNGDERMGVYPHALKALAQQSLSKLGHAPVPRGSEAERKQDLAVTMACTLMEQRTGWKFGVQDSDHWETRCEEWATLLRKNPKELFRAAETAERLAEWVLQPEKRRELEQSIETKREERAVSKPVYQAVPALPPDQEFAQFCTDFGLKVDRVIADGHWHSVALASDKGHEKSGGYRVYFNDRPNGWVKNHKTGEAARWISMGQTLSKEEREQLRRDAATIKAARQQEITEGYAKAAKKAYGLFANAHPAPEDHPYLARKGVRPLGLKATDEGTLLVPVQDVNGRLMSLQFINEEGEKRFLTGGQKHGGMLVMDPKAELELRPVIIAEGYATAASICESLKEPVVVAFDAGNLMPVAEALRRKYPDKPLIIAADNDHSHQFNAGVEKAAAAARAVGGILVVPEFNDLQKAQGLTDFNDLHRSAGRSAVQEAFAPALEEARTLKADLRRERRLEQDHLITF